MIRIDRNYVIDVDRYNYTLMKDNHKVGKDGKPLYSVLGYYRSLQHALLGLLEETNNQKLNHKQEITLEEAIDKLKRNENKVIKLITKAVPEAKDWFK